MVHIGHTGVSKLRSRDPILQGELVNFHVPSSWRLQAVFREPILHKSRRKDLQVGQETAEIPANGLVVVREAGEQEAGKPSYAIPTNTKIDAGANFRATLKSKKCLPSQTNIPNL